MNKSFKKFVLLLVLMFCVLAGFLVFRQAARISEFGKKADYGQQPFERNNPSATLKILIVGDSTAVGTGARDNTTSTAGWFGQDFPDAHIVNFSKNGLTLEGLLQDFHPQPGNHYSLIVAQIGANDIMHFTSMEKIKDRLSQVIDRLKPLGDTLVILHSGHVGLAPIFSWPSDEILGWRSRKVREIYQQVARSKGILYVDLYTERHNDLFLKDIKRYYSADLLHPSGYGYRHWYQRIRETLDDAGVKL